MFTLDNLMNIVIALIIIRPPQADEIIRPSNPNADTYHMSDAKQLFGSGLMKDMTQVPTSIKTTTTEQIVTSYFPLA